jgi:NAD(P)H dehydrogenase (quinone)
MRVLYLYCHPGADSFHSGIKTEALASLKDAGHEVDLCDLYAENFAPILTADMRRDYHNTSLNQIGLEAHIQRLQRAEALVVQFPTWCFGMPAMLKGYLDRMILPGVAFDLSNPADVKPMLGHIKAIHGIVTYGRPRWVALYMGDPPRKAITRYLPWFTGSGLWGRRAKVRFHALYHMNIATMAQRADFIARVRDAMSKLG